MSKMSDLYIEQNSITLTESATTETSKEGNNA